MRRSALTSSATRWNRSAVFDPETQRSATTLRRLTLHAANEVLLNDEQIGRFRKGYAEAFGGLDLNDPLYESITAGRRYQGMEHWLPLFHERLETLFDYLPESPVSLDQSAAEAIAARQDQINEFYDARREAREQGHLRCRPLQAVAARHALPHRIRSGRNASPIIPTLASRPLKIPSRTASRLRRGVAAASHWNARSRKQHL